MSGCQTNRKSFFDAFILAATESWPVFIAGRNPSRRRPHVVSLFSRSRQPQPGSKHSGAKAAEARLDEVSRWRDEAPDQRCRGNSLGMSCDSASRSLLPKLAALISTTTTRGQPKRVVSGRRVQSCEAKRAVMLAFSRLTGGFAPRLTWCWVEPDANPSMIHAHIWMMSRPTLLIADSSKSGLRSAI